MVKKILIIFISAVVLFFALMLLVPTEKDRFKHDIKSFRRAIEQENIQEAILYISPDYQDGNGMVYESFQDIVENLAEEFDSLNVSMSGLKLQIDSTTTHGTIFASCSLGLKLFARYQGERTILYGGIIRPASVKAWFKKTTDCYQVYNATY